MGADPRSLFQSSIRSARPERIRDDIPFQPRDADHPGLGDIVPLYPFARSLASLESVVGLFYLANTVARLVTLWLRMA
jgi:hypothetical protein